jgi:sterol desaturase/sphingolipid hydroxylase (fatty acid hydroxylase superfamily)
VSDGYNLYVDGAINGAPALLMVDTGAFATLLHRSFVKRMKIPLRDTPFRSAAVNLNMRDVQIARIRRLSVVRLTSSVTMLALLIWEDSFTAGCWWVKRPVAGLLGSELLQRHHGIIDFGTRRLYLKG